MVVVNQPVASSKSTKSKSYPSQPAFCGSKTDRKQIANQRKETRCAASHPKRSVLLAISKFELVKIHHPPIESKEKKKENQITQSNDDAAANMIERTNITISIIDYRDGPHDMVVVVIIGKLGVEVVVWFGLSRTSQCRPASASEMTLPSFEGFLGYGNGASWLL